MLLLEKKNFYYFQTIIKIFEMFSNLFLDFQKNQKSIKKLFYLLKSYFKLVITLLFFKNII